MEQHRIAAILNPRLIRKLNMICTEAERYVRFAIAELFISEIPGTKPSSEFAQSVEFDRRKSR